jgi:hypothetical protein
MEVMRMLSHGCGGYLLVCRNGGPGSCASPCGIYGEQSVIVTFFCDNICFAVSVIAPMICTHISFICIWYILLADDSIIKENISVSVSFYKNKEIDYEI